jgi:uncharacterized membrane protein
MPNGEEIFDEAQAAEELEKERGVSRLEAAKEMAKRKAEEAIKKAAKKAAAKVAVTVGKALLAALKAIWAILGPALAAVAPYILIIGGIILAVFLVVSVLMSGDTAICDELIKDQGFFNAVKEMYEIGGIGKSFPCVVAGIKELGPGRAVEEASTREEEIYSTIQGGF